MGFFDKARTFLGGHGCKVEITRLERQDPSDVAFPMHDSVFKGNFRITAGRPCTVLAHLFEVCVMRKHADGREEVVVLGEDRHDEKTEIIGSELKWPYEMNEGEAKEDSFLVSGIDIPGALDRMGYLNPRAAIAMPELTFFVRVTADVKGTPLDADAKVQFKVVE